MSSRNLVRGATAVLLFFTATTVLLSPVQADPISRMKKVGYSLLYKMEKFANGTHIYNTLMSNSTFSNEKSNKLEALLTVIKQFSSKDIASRCVQKYLAEELPIVLILGIDISKCPTYNDTSLGCKGSATVNEVTTLLGCVLKNINGTLGAVQQLVKNLESTSLQKALVVVKFIIYALLTNVTDLLKVLNLSNLMNPYLPMLLGCIVYGLGFGLYAARNDLSQLVGVVVLILFHLLFPILTLVFQLLAEVVNLGAGDKRTSLINSITKLLGDTLGNDGGADGGADGGGDGGGLKGLVDQLLGLVTGLVTGLLDG